MQYEEINSETFETLLSSADQKFLNKKRNYDKKTCFVCKDKKSGFALTHDGMLCHVFSLEKGMGKYAVWDAIVRGANRLSCYDGYLPSYYNKFGFVTAIREKMSEGPDKHWMILRKNRKTKGASVCVL